jgi:hypothetical protein
MAVYVGKGVVCVCYFEVIGSQHFLLIIQGHFCIVKGRWKLFGKGKVIMRKQVINLCQNRVLITQPLTHMLHQ